MSTVEERTELLARLIHDGSESVTEHPDNDWPCAAADRYRHVALYVVAHDVDRTAGLDELLTAVMDQIARLNIQHSGALGDVLNRLTGLKAELGR